MQIEELKNTLNTLIEKQVPTFIWGSPGIGKSSIVKEIAKEREVEFLDLRLSLLDPTDLKGIPFFDSSNNQAVWAAPEFLPQDRESLGILFLDEINTAPPSVQAAAYQLVLDRRVGDYTLPDGWAIVAAGNKESDRGVVYRMPSPLANRFVHLELEVSFEKWKKWAYEQGIEPSIIAFLHYEPSWLFTFNPQEQQKAFATPRSWEYVDKIVKSDLQASTLLETLSGTIGKEAAIAYLAFKKVMQKLPDIDAIL
ncbi:MAG TPA: AAA family ATPase, partial [Nitratifractor sp.]|nr:AAA family ATPase [Nitratifractor sp.]